jgi:hypothetical protein
MGKHKGNSKLKLMINDDRKFVWATYDEIKKYKAQGYKLVSPERN